MKFNKYQRLAISTAFFPEKISIPYCALGLGGESGEVQEKVKKVLRDHDGDFSDPERNKAIALELGDVLWYMANLADHLGFTLEEVAEMNLAKLASRQERGKMGGSGDDR